MVRERIRMLKRLNVKKINYSVYLKETINNIFIAVKNRKNRLLYSKSSGVVGFKGKKRFRSFAAVALIKNLASKIRFKSIRVIVLSKISKNMKTMLKNLHKSGVKIAYIKERIPVPHNGLRLPKPRRM
jgi:small subunit ribosomal protein S11